MNNDDNTQKPYVSSIHLGKIVRSAVGAEEQEKRMIEEIDRRIVELETKAQKVGITGKLRIEQSLEELRRERALILGEEPQKETQEL